MLHPILLVFTDLFSPEDKDEIIGACRAATKAAGLVDTNENVWRFFIQRVRVRVKGGRLGAGAWAAMLQLFW